MVSRKNENELQDLGQDMYPISVPDDMDLQSYGGNSKAEDQVSFVRKVLGIVAGQMAVTFVSCLVSSLVPEVGAFF
jgi:hypothetical protein